MEQLDQSVANTIRILAQTVQEVCLPDDMAEACPTPLTRNQFLILNLLAIRHARAVGEIARILQVTPPAICRAVDKLEDRDMVERRVRPSDHRTHDVMLRPEGRKLVERFIAITEERQTYTLNHFNRTEKEQLLELLNRYIGIALENEKNTEAMCLLCTDRSGARCALPGSATNCLRRRNN